MVLISYLIAQCTVMGHSKLINVQQAKTTYAYKNRKDKLQRTNACIWFSKMCLLNYLVPTYIKITNNGYDRQCQNTNNAATTYRINQENRVVCFTGNISTPLLLDYYIHTKGHPSESITNILYLYFKLL